MVAKKKDELDKVVKKHNKTDKKTTKPTTVKGKAKTKKTTTKRSKKVTKKVIKIPVIEYVKEPVITDELFENWFMNQPSKKFVQLTKQWNDEKLNIVLKPQENYDKWLDYFKTLPPNSIRLLAKTGLDILPTEAYAALARWHDIIANPSRIDKIHQAGLTNPVKGKPRKTISELAQKNDRLGVLEATRDKIAEKLDKGAGARDTAALTREMTDIMSQIADYQKRQGPKKTTLLGQLLSDMPNNTTGKRPSKNGGGARNGSFKSRVTIEDLDK